MKTVDDQLKHIIEIVYKNKETTERLEANWDKDRKDFSEFQNRLGHLETEFKGLKDLIRKLPERTQTRVEETVQSIIDTTDALTETIGKKRIISIKDKKSWWPF